MSRNHGTPESSEPTDAELCARLARGEVDALGPLFDRHAVSMRRVVRRLGVPMSEVDDVVQSAFLDVLGAAARYDGRASARPWLLGFAVIQARRHRRSLARIAARLAAWAREADLEIDDSESHAAHRLDAVVAMRALEALSGKKRETFVLVALEGLATDEVARILEIPVATVWTRMFHARRELRAVLDREGER